MDLKMTPKFTKCAWCGKKLQPKTTRLFRPVKGRYHVACKQEKDHVEKNTKDHLRNSDGRSKIYS